MIRHLSLLAAGLSLVWGFQVPAAEAAPLRVVATLSTFADLVEQVGGEHVAVDAVASPKFNAHFIEPKPSDVLKVKRAALFVHAGLDLEAWRGPLVDAAGNRNVMAGADGELDLSRGIALLEVPNRPVSRADGDIHLYGNPHYWTDPRNARIMANAICEKLCAQDPAHCEEFRRNLQGFLARLETSIEAWHNTLAPLAGREVVGYHNEWPYLMGFAGLRMEQFLEPKPGIPPSPRQVEFIERYIRERGIPAIVQASFEPQQTGGAVARRTGTKLVILAQNVRELPEASDYLAMIEYNVQQLVRALGEET